jgi:hypothetical protein
MNPGIFHDYMMKSDTRNVLVLVCHLAVLLLLGPTALASNPGGMFNGLDGDYMRILVSLQQQWMPLSTYISSNPLQGMGNIFFPFNMNLVPAFFVQRLLGYDDISPPFAYTIFAVEMFLATYLIARVLGFRHIVGIAGGWIIVLLALPLKHLPRLYAVYGLVPNVVDLLVVMAVIIWAFHASRAESGRPARFAAYLALATVPTMATLQNPLFVMIIVPASTVWGMVAAANGSRAGLRAVLRPAAVATGGIVASGAAVFLLGNTLNTVPTFFSKELQQGQAILHNASIVFQGGNIGLLLVGVSALGAFSCLLQPTEKAMRWTGTVHLAMTALTIAGGWAIVKFASDWRGPQMVYFELALWPFYAIFAAEALILLISVPVARLGKIAGMEPATILPVAVGIAALAVLIHSIVKPESPPSRPFPPRADAIVRYLANEIAISANTDFRGQVVTYTGGISSESGTGWFEQAPFDAALEKATGNDHRFVGLWYYGIPTLQEYNHYITPSSYLLFSRLLARSVDRQIRSITVLTKPNINLLTSLGVRFIVSDVVLPGPAILRLAEPVDIDRGRLTLYLYELPDPNLGNWSPRRVISVRTADHALTEIAKSDLRHSVVTATQLPDPLAPARNVRLTFLKGGVHVVAEAVGHSLLILPLQFSRCLRHINGTQNASVFRANLVQTGIVFSDQLDITLQFRSGLLGDSKCRLDDYLEMKAFELKAAASIVPLAQR